MKFRKLSTAYFAVLSFSYFGCGKHDLKVNNTNKKATIFTKIIGYVIIPEIIVFAMIAYLSYHQLAEVFKQEQRTQIEYITQEIASLNKIANSGFEFIETAMKAEVNMHSYKIVNKFQGRYEELFAADLNQLRIELKMDTIHEDIYIINPRGTIVNTTFLPDSGVNVFTYGHKFKEFIEDVFSGGELVSEPFTFERATGKMKKFAYIPTTDRKFVVELGIYSDEANAVLDLIETRFSEIVYSQKNIQSIELFVGEENPFPLFGDTLTNDDNEVLKQVAMTGRDTTFMFNDTLRYTYSVSRKNTYATQVIRIVYSTAEQHRMLQQELFSGLLVFLLGLSCLFMLLLYNVRKITQPLKELVFSADKIGQGKLHTRIQPKGTKETVSLAMQFNEMAESLEVNRTELTDQRNQLAEKNEKITDSITYAQRIQEAILPPDKLFHEFLPESFVLYKPKDIVAGDFYWIDKVEDKVIFAAADCTGHGVPGAMVSVVCHTAMNRAVREFNLTAPAAILTKVRELVIATFERSEHEVKDGMDIALCTLDVKNMVVQFAGAYNPLYLIRNGELSETEGDRLSISKSREMPTITGHEMPLQKGDMLYVFSDGYADQFGGPKLKKFKYNQLRKLLVDHHEKPMEEQKLVIDKTYEEWRGGTEQIDDVCLIGVRV